MGIVIARNSGAPTVLLLEKESQWLFPKGHVSQGETFLETACREVHEETNVSVSADNCLGLVHKFRYCFEHENHQVQKTVHVFLFVLDSEPLITFNREEGFVNGAWIPVYDAMACLSHVDAQEALRRSLLRYSVSH